MKDSNHKLGKAFSVDTGTEKWQSQEFSTQSDPLIDPGTGKPYIIRFFEFKFDVSMLHKLKEHKIPVPNNQELFNSVWPQIRVMLWGDGLVAVQEAELPPKIVIEKRKFKVAIVCQAKFGNTIIDKVRTLNDYLHPKK